MVGVVFSVSVHILNIKARSFLSLFKGVPCCIVISVLEYVK